MLATTSSARLADPGFDLAAVRAEFPLTARWTYLNHASDSPMPIRAAKAAAERIAVLQEPPLERGQREVAAARARAHLGRMLAVPPTQIAFLTNLAEATSTVANGLAWRAGDEVVLVEGEFASLVYPWRNLEHRGVRIVWVPKDGPATNLNRIEAALSPKTRAVAISHVEYQHGFRNDIAALGGLCRARDALLMVDVSQSLGGIPLDAETWGADAIAGVTNKWLMGSHGLAVLAVSEAAMERIRPTVPGRLSIGGGWQDAAYALDWHPDARRYQGGGLNWLAVVALAESLDLLAEVGPAGPRHALALADDLIARLGDSGVTVTSDVRPDHRSQIMSLSFGSREADAAFATRAEAAGVALGHRGFGIRVGLHCWNTTADTDRLLELVGAALA